MLNALDPPEEIVEDVPAAIVSEWLANTGWGVKYAHEASQGAEEMPLDPPMGDDDLRRRFELFEDALGGILRTFFATTDELDEILGKANR